MFEERCSLSLMAQAKYQKTRGSCPGPGAAPGPRSSRGQGWEGTSTCLGPAIPSDPPGHLGLSDAVHYRGDPLRWLASGRQTRRPLECASGEEGGAAGPHGGHLDQGLRRP